MGCSGLPGNRVEAYRAGMTPISFMSREWTQARSLGRGGVMGEVDAVSVRAWIPSRPTESPVPLRANLAAVGDNRIRASVEWGYSEKCIVYKTKILISPLKHSK